MTPASIKAKRGLDNYDVLVLDAGSRQSLASARSFGRAGLRVALGECFAECEPDLPVLAFTSRYSARNIILPNYAIDGSAFADGVVDFVREHPTRVVLPTADGAIAAMAPRRGQLAAMGCVLALAPDPALAIANDKDRTLAIASELGIAYPKTMPVKSVADVPELAARFEFPVVLKPTTSWVSGSPVRLQAVEVVDEAEATKVVEAFSKVGAEVLAQQWVGGRREGVTMFVVEGEIKARCGHIAHRTSPALGGASILRESTGVPADIDDSSVRLVRAIGLEGLCEVEYRRDLSGRPFLMEVNARIAGTIENALHSGVDFPLMLWQWAAGQRVQPIDSYRNGVRTRWLRGDMRWLRDNFRRTGRPDSVSKARGLWMFGSEFVRTRYYDCFDRSDFRPALAELRTTAAAVWHSRNPNSVTEHASRKEA
ncbi:MAG: ATP-grasp domain-containing protein [Nocardiopsaceae bacterium]|nr:ATP-grasp domain-containing protein [Nocardiopsaceae bacterium]